MLQIPVSPTDADGSLAVELSRLAIALELLPLPVAVFDDALRLVHANPRFYQLSGLPVNTVGRHMREAFPTALSEMAPLVENASRGVRQSGRVTFMLDEGPRLVEASLTPLGDRLPDGGVVFMATDVTEQERATAHEARARERRLAAVGQLAAGVMHDMNNALNPIVAAAYLLDVHANDPGAVRDYARRIGMAAETGAATAARVGRFIRQEPLQGAREDLVDIGVVADEVLAMTRPVWAERLQSGGIELVRVNGASALTRGIAGEVREAMLNLVQNALDAMPTGGTLTVSTGADADRSWIEVRDSGPGMTDEVRDRAFEPFFSTKGRKGTGLGLAEVYGIMKRHRGQAEITTAPGQGATVRLTFPRASTRANTERVESPERRPQRVLIAEDHEDGREFMRALLASDGHAVIATGGVAEALAHLDIADPPFDLLLADIGLPDGSGWDLIRAARERSPGIRVGVVTGWEPTNTPPVHIDFALRKPVPAQALLNLVAGQPAST